MLTQLGTIQVQMTSFLKGSRKERWCDLESFIDAQSNLLRQIQRRMLSCILPPQPSYKQIQTAFILSHIHLICCIIDQEEPCYGNDCIEVFHISMGGGGTVHVMSLILKTESHPRTVCMTVNISGVGKRFCTRLFLNLLLSRLRPSICFYTS